MKTTIKITILLLAIAMTGCSPYRCCDDYNALLLFKTKNDYSNNLMISSAGPNERINEIYYSKPSIFANGYESRGCCIHPDNCAFLSITIDEWRASHETTPMYVIDDSLKNKVIDWYPFVEFYEWENYPLSKNGTVDTVRINNTIIKGELEKYAKRLK